MQFWLKPFWLKPFGLKGRSGSCLSHARGIHPMDAVVLRVGKIKVHAVRREGFLLIPLKPMEWQPFQRPMLCSRKLLRRKFRPQMRWWMQKLHKPSNQRGARMRSLFPAGTQISLGIPSSSDVQIPESQDFLDIQARILGRQHGNSGSFLQPWNQKHKAVRELLWKVFARPAAQAQPNGWLEIKPMPWPWDSQVLETKPGKICGLKKGHAHGQRQAGGLPKGHALMHISHLLCVTSACTMSKKMCAFLQQQLWLLNFYLAKKQ